MLHPIVQGRNSTPEWGLESLFYYNHVIVTGQSLQRRDFLLLFLPCQQGCYID